MAKTYVEDINRIIYDIRNEDNYDIKLENGINENIVREISKIKDEPKWMLELRLKALKQYEELPLPTWGPKLDELNMDNISTYVKPKSNLHSEWKDVPKELLSTFNSLGVCNNQEACFAGVGAQYDSEVIYHNLTNVFEKQGIIYLDMDTALKKHPDLVKEYFSKCIDTNYHKFIALHYAVWSGGSFVYVPKDTKVSMPIQSYFRLNSPSSGQFEHTLIILEENSELHFIEGCSAPSYNEVNLHAGCVELYVKENSHLTYSTIENWSKNMMNLNTKKAIVEKNAKMDWITGSFGSKISMLYPLSLLNGENAKTEYTGISFAAENQILDTGFKVIHNAPNTSSVVDSRSISKSGGKCTFRSLVLVNNKAENSKNSVSCESLMIDNESVSNTIPYSNVLNNSSILAHEASIGKISDKEIFYLMNRGLSELDAKAMIVRGFASPISKKFPIEYAMEMNNLINLELEGAIG